MPQLFTFYFYLSCDCSAQSIWVFWFWYPCGFLHVCVRNELGLYSVFLYVCGFSFYTKLGNVSNQLELNFIPLHIPNPILCEVLQLFLLIRLHQQSLFVFCMMTIFKPSSVTITSHCINMQSLLAQSQFATIQNKILDVVTILTKTVKLLNTRSCVIPNPQFLPLTEPKQN